MRTTLRLPDGNTHRGLFEIEQDVVDGPPYADMVHTSVALASGMIRWKVVGEKREEHWQVHCHLWTEINGQIVPEYDSTADLLYMRVG